MTLQAASTACRHIGFDSLPMIRGIVCQSRHGTFGATIMVIVKGTRRFELSVEAHYDEWRAALREFVPGRLYPTQHLLRTFDSRHTAIEALVRKWRMLFPEDPPLTWREPSLIPPRRQSRRPRQ